MSIYLPNLDELSFRFVFALPKHSRIIFDCNNMFLTLYSKEKRREDKFKTKKTSAN
jgi:hypothetical protein